MFTLIEVRRHTHTVDCRDELEHLLFILGLMRFLLYFDASLVSNPLYVYLCTPFYDHVHTHVLGAEHCEDPPGACGWY